MSEDEMAINNAIASRGFYLSDFGNINYQESRQCGNYQLQSHRGSVRFPENSVNAVVDALDNNFDVVEVDVRLTRDDVWVVHHDGWTGRETGAVDNKRRRIESLSYQREWGYLRTRDQSTGQLLNSVPPRFRDIARAFTYKSKPHQLLNIEIKSRVSVRDLELLDYLAFTHIGPGRYFYSSLNLSNLENMRNINSNVFLSFIQGPSQQSIEVVKENLKDSVSSDPIYLRHERLLENIAGVGSRVYRERRYDNQRGMAKLNEALRVNYGMAIDIRQFSQNPSRIKSLATQNGVTIATYSVNGQDYHSSRLLAIDAKNRPFSVIIDDTVYGFCTAYELPVMRPYEGANIIAKRLASLPKDLDLERLDELGTYYFNGLYPALGGQLKAIEGNVYTSSYAPVFLNTSAGPRQADSAVELESDQPVRVEVRTKH